MRKEIADGTDRETGCSKEISFEASNQTESPQVGLFQRVSMEVSIGDGGLFGGQQAWGTGQRIINI